MCGLSWACQRRDQRALSSAPPSLVQAVQALQACAQEAAPAQQHWRPRGVSLHSASAWEWPASVPQVRWESCGPPSAAAAWRARPCSLPCPCAGRTTQRGPRVCSTLSMRAPTCLLRGASVLYILRAFAHPQPPRTLVHTRPHSSNQEERHESACYHANQAVPRFQALLHQTSRLVQRRSQVVQRRSERLCHARLAPASTPSPSPPTCSREVFPSHACLEQR